MSNKLFYPPVTFARGPHAIYKIETVEDAVRDLLRRWPLKCFSGLNFNLAQEACRAALAGECEVEQARAAFLLALQEAGLDVMEEAYTLH